MRKKHNYKLCQCASCKSIRGELSGKNHPTWKGGKNMHGGGYIRIYQPNHSNAQNNMYILEHRLVMEAYINKISYKKWLKYGLSGNYPKKVIFLKSCELIHHLNGIKNDNRPKNLALVTKKTHDVKSYIKQLHHLLKILQLLLLRIF